MTIRDSNFITILAPMITKLKLKGNELLVFALIHGFSQDGESRFKGSLRYLIEWTGLDKSTVIKLLKQLVDKQYINKFEYEKNKVRYCEYTSNYWVALEWLENPTTPRLENPTTVVGKSDTIKIDDINTSFDNDNTGVKNPGLFPDEETRVEEPKEKKTLFRNSAVCKMVKFENGVGVDYSEFESKFATPEFEKVDLVYYFHAVADWSDQKNMKRTKNGWLATVRNFIRGDVERNKLHLKPQFQQSKSKINVSDAVKYLNDDF